VKSRERQKERDRVLGDGERRKRGSDGRRMREMKRKGGVGCDRGGARGRQREKARERERERERERKREE